MHALRAAARRLRQGIRRAAPTTNVRATLAGTFLAGDGLEVGALHNPLPVPPAARVTYVDRLPVEELKARHQELGDVPFAPVHLVDDGERLSKVADGSQDFVIANHFLEHCQDPLGTAIAFHRVLRPGGVLYLALPDKRHTFDRDRPVTPLSHLLRDHREGPAWSRDAHVEEWVRLVDHVSDPAAVRAKVAELIAIDYSIHYHVFTPIAMLQMVAAFGTELGLPLDVELFQRNGSEGIFILRRA